LNLLVVVRRIWRRRRRRRRRSSVRNHEEEEKEQCYEYALEGLIEIVHENEEALWCICVVNEESYGSEVALRLRINGNSNGLLRLFR
jgi:hypothetical protein